MRACVIEKSIIDVRALQRFFSNGFGPTMEQIAEFRHSILNGETLDIGRLRRTDPTTSRSLSSDRAKLRPYARGTGRGHRFAGRPDGWTLPARISVLH